MIALITPTGARHEQFSLCSEWMKRQTYNGNVIWIIIDDVYPITTNSVQEDFRDKWIIHKVYPTPIWAGNNTQSRNIKAGIDYLKNNYDLKDIKVIFIIEDDDYYKENYLSEMVKRIGTYDVIGETNTIYYNVQWRQYCDNNNKQHASLFQTAFTPKVLPHFEANLKHKFIDVGFWAHAPNKFLFFDNYLSVGMKGMPGREGIGAGHKRTMFFLQDQSMRYLKQLIGEENAKFYERYYGNHNFSQSDILTKKRV